MNGGKAAINLHPIIKNIKMKLRHLYITALLLILFGSACKKSGIIDGGLSKEKVDLTTYDFLKSNPHQI